MKKQYYIIAYAAAALAGCDTSPQVVTGGGPADPRGGPELANAVANVQLPPSIVASHKYRCGSDVISIDWLSDGKVNSARVTPASGVGVQLAQGEAGGDYTGTDAVLKGDPQKTEVNWNGKSCKR